MLFHKNHTISFMLMDRYITFKYFKTISLHVFTMILRRYKLSWTKLPWGQRLESYRGAPLAPPLCCHPLSTLLKTSGAKLERHSFFLADEP